MQHAVIAHLRLIEDPFGSEREREIIADLTSELQHAINVGNVGEFDGEEFGGGKCVIYMYGPNADQLFAVVEPILCATPLARGGFAIKRYGEAKDLNAAEVKVGL
ncbi:MULTISPECIES: hypothetical protein [Methylosinus]|uniref:DUF695 domain-containing protein n=1 Tax=Methylosinus trichosporium (strain ATCC 35070 / NCIMB 11131 / UNIQEM 75 / OB3b) TaxID=595536 RepID=A0A2D2D7Y0_METT3|nr:MULTISPECIES: hypothetical protein [Methylosinus]ATQ70949.1 hypothetical protein CQW49_23665 [Methylosinus trichosporium OB3b]OBS54215.1 hypothetical protein A8B73_01775 [Methylosinus sp. 3S-1]